jgi:hypothetical protein
MFIIFFTPIFFEFCSFFIRRTKEYIEILGFAGFLKYSYLELIYTLMILLIFGVIAIPNKLCQVSLRMPKKEIFIWASGVVLMCFLYFKFNLHFQ